MGNLILLLFMAHPKTAVITGGLTSAGLLSTRMEADYISFRRPDNSKVSFFSTSRG
jgi:hypothetical protein